MANEQQDPAAPYRLDNFQVLRASEHIRKRPPMYIGDVGPRGLHRLVYQLAANSLAEAAEGYGRSLAVTLNADGLVEIADEGRGIDPAPHPTLGKPVLEAVLTEVFSPGSVHPGRDWQDYAIANALAEWFLVETQYDGQMYRQEYQRGRPVAPPWLVGPCSGSGVKVAFRPDPFIFPDLRLSYTALRDRLLEYAFLHSGMRISVSDGTAGAEERFEFADGIRAFVQTLNGKRQPLHPEVLVGRGEETGVRNEIGLQWCRESKEFRRSFVNDEETNLGGTHVTGFLEAVTHSINSFVRKAGLKIARVLKGDEARRGLTAVVSVQLPKPEFGGATKDRLVSKEAQSVVRSGVGLFLQKFFYSNPAVVETVVRAAIAEADK